MCVLRKNIWYEYSVLYDIIWIDLDDTSHVHIFWTNPWRLH